MTNITNPKVLKYYSDICKEWNFTPTQKTATGYESVEKDLKKLSKEKWAKADDAGKALIQQEVFDIYRTKNILPITSSYFEFDFRSSEHLYLNLIPIRCSF